MYFPLGSLYLCICANTQTVSQDTPRAHVRGLLVVCRGWLIAEEELKVGSQVLSFFPRAALPKPVWYLALHVKFSLKKEFQCLDELGSHSSSEGLRESNLFLVMDELKRVG